MFAFISVGAVESAWRAASMYYSGRIRHCRTRPQLSGPMLFFGAASIIRSKRTAKPVAKSVSSEQNPSSDRFSDGQAGSSTWAISSGQPGVCFATRIHASTPTVRVDASGPAFVAARNRNGWRGNSKRGHLRCGVDLSSIGGGGVLEEDQPHCVQKKSADRRHHLGSVLEARSPQFELRRSSVCSSRPTFRLLPTFPYANEHEIRLRGLRSAIIGGFFRRATPASFRKLRHATAERLTQAAGSPMWRPQKWHAAVVDPLPAGAEAAGRQQAIVGCAPGRSGTQSAVAHADHQRLCRRWASMRAIYSSWFARTSPASADC